MAEINTHLLLLIFFKILSRNLEQQIHIIGAAFIVEPKINHPVQVAMQVRRVRLTP